jgi:toxin ParE1/3/4
MGPETRAEGTARVMVVWSPRAIGHLADLREYIARDNPGAAGRVATALLVAVDRLAKLPSLGRPGRVTGTRELVVPGTPYVIPYRLRGDRLEIIAVFHGRQRWPKRL